MKIGIVTEYFYPTLGGITENIYHFSRELLRNGHEFRIITGKDKLANYPPECEGRIISIGKSVPVFYNGSCARVTMGFGLTRKMKEVLAAEQFDLVHVHSPIFPTLPIIAIMQSTVPVVGTFHTVLGGHDDLYYKVYKERCTRLLDGMTGRIAVSECCARELEDYFDRSFDVIPNGVDVDWWVDGTRKVEKFDDGKFNVLFLGRPDTRNGLSTLIHAFANVHRRFPETRLIIVGDGPLRFYFERLVPADVANAIVFEGAANENRPDYLATADAFVFAPDIASFGITILEGMSAGKAMIASDIEAFRALVTDGESALLIPPGDEAAMAHSIERLITDESFREDLGATAALRVSRYDWKRVAEMQIEYYRNILSGRQISDVGVRGRKSEDPTSAIRPATSEIRSHVRGT
jgi:phosphatidylinositol alpha-mannosyltransferase